MKKMTFSFAFCLLIRTFVPPMEYALLVKGYRRRPKRHRNMKVLKFGGTSVGSVKSILSLKKIVETEARTQPVIVVDATCHCSSQCVRWHHGQVDNDLTNSPEG